MSVNTYQHSFEFLNAIEATIEHSVRAGQVPQVIIHYHHRATADQSTPASFYSRYNRSALPVPPGLSALTDSRIVTNTFQYKLVPVPDSEVSSGEASTVTSRAHPVRSSTGLSTPEPTPRRPPNRAEDPRRCQSLTQKGAQCLLVPAAARNVVPYGFYCWRHGNTGDVPIPARSTVNNNPLERVPSFFPITTPTTSTRTSLPLPPQRSSPIPPYAISSHASTTSSASLRAHPLSSRPAQRLLTPSPEPQPTTAQYFEHPTNSAQDPFVQHQASQNRPPPPPRPLRLPQILRLSPQISTGRLVNDSPAQSPSTSSSPSPSPSSSPSPSFRRTYRTNGSSSFSALGWPTTPARSGFRRESVIVATPEPEHDRLASPVSSLSPTSPTLLLLPLPSLSTTFTSRPSPASSPVLSSVEPLAATPPQSPVLSPVLVPLSPSLPSVASAPVFSANQLFLLGATPEPVQTYYRYANLAPRVQSLNSRSETHLTRDAESTQPGGSRSMCTQAQRNWDTFQQEQIMATEIHSTPQSSEQPDAVSVEDSTRLETFEFGKTGIRRSSVPKFSFQYPVPRSNTELPFRQPHQSADGPSTGPARSTISQPSMAEPVPESELSANATESDRLCSRETDSPCERTAIPPSVKPSAADVAEQSLARSQKQSSAENQEATPSPSPSPSDDQPPALAPLKSRAEAQSEAKRTPSAAPRSSVFVSRLPRPSATTAPGLESSSEPRQRPQSRLSSCIPRLAVEPCNIPESSQNVAFKAQLPNEQVSKNIGRRRSTLGRLSTACATGSCPRAARRSEGSTKPIDFFIRNGSERFSDYIPQDLSSTTQEKLRTRMQQAPTGSAAKGYIYAFEVAGMSTDDHICVKLGRTTDPEEPLRQWRRQCPGAIKPGRVWPALMAQENQTAGGPTSAQMFEYCSTLEGLVRLELEDIAQYNGHISHTRSSCETLVNQPGIKCKNCSSRHNDIYTIKRHGGSDGRTDWDLLGDIVQGWAQFVTRYCGQGQAPRCASS